MKSKEEQYRLDEKTIDMRLQELEMLKDLLQSKP